MKANELTAPVGEWVRRLKCASSTIEADVLDALEQSQRQADFIGRAENAIWSLIGECNDWLNHLERAEVMSREQCE